MALAPVSLRLKQWQRVYDLGKWSAPPIATLSGAIWSLLAYTSYSSGTVLRTPSSSSSSLVGQAWVLYAMAGLATFGFMPYTIIVMLSLNNELQRRNLIEERKVDYKTFEDESSSMIEKWAVLNYVRAAFPMAGAILGLYASLA